MALALRPEPMKVSPLAAPMVHELDLDVALNAQPIERGGGTASPGDRASAGGRTTAPDAGK
jgi:hypothetical protein